MHRTTVIGWAAVLALACAPADAEEGSTGRQGTLTFSDGTSLQGTVTLSPESLLRIHTGDGLRTLPLEHARELRWSPEKESMERKWRFEEAGQTRKKFWGTPYPVRRLRTDILLSPEGTLSGHLYTLPLYIEADGHTQRVVLKAKQKGPPGGSFEELVYPVRLAFDAADRRSVSGPVVQVGADAGRHAIAVAGLTVGPLVRLEARRMSGQGCFRLPPLLGAALFLAVRTENAVRVGWPDSPADTARAAVMQAMPFVKDFFDRREVLGVLDQPEHRRVYTLMLLSRQGKTTLNRERSQPWRIEVWRWKSNDEGKLMLAGRGMLFRGAVDRTGTEPLPAVSPAPDIWEAAAGADKHIRIEWITADDGSAHAE